MACHRYSIQVRVWTGHAGAAPGVLTAFLPGRDVHFVYFDGTNEIEGWHFERADEALDAPMHRLVRFLNFAQGSAETRVKPVKRVNREQPPTECNPRVSEDRASLIVERAVATLTEIPLKLSVAAVSDRAVRTAARASSTVTPANPCQQAR